MAEPGTSRPRHRRGFAILLLSAALWAITTVFFIGVWDHVWLKKLLPVSCHAVRRVNSDHRMVVADVLFDSMR